MKIIKNNVPQPPETAVVCHGCASELRYTESDLRPLGMLTEGFPFQTLLGFTCPCCTAEITAEAVAV